MPQEVCTTVSSQNAETFTTHCSIFTNKQAADVVSILRAQKGTIVFCAKSSQDPLENSNGRFIEMVK